MVEPLRRHQPLVLDLGANRGAFARAVSEAFGGDFHLAEPNPALAAELTRTTPFHVAQYAVGAVHSAVRFNIAKNDEASSILDLPAASAYDAVLDSVVNVDQVTLQELVTAHGRVVDVVKLDIEGAEVAALAALTDVALSSIAQITVEFHCHPSFGYGGEEETRDLIERFEANGFVVLDFSPGHKMDVLMLNLSAIKPTGAQAFVLRVMPELLWLRQRRELVRSWRRARLGLRPRDLLTRRRPR